MRKAPWSWSRKYRSGGQFQFNAMRLADDGGGAGRTSLHTDGLTDMGWRGDFWLVRTDSNGVLQWSRRFGGGYMDLCHAMAVARDGGFLLAGSTDSFRDRGGGWLLKVSAGGDSLWSRFFAETFYAAERAPDDGFFLASGAHRRPRRFRTGARE